MTSPVARFVTATLLFGLALAVPAADAAGIGMVVARGTAHGDPAALEARDQRPGDDDPAAYVRLDPDGGRFVGRFWVPAPASADLELFVARRAPAWAEGRWRIQVKDHERGAWDEVLTSNDVMPGRWMLRRAALDPVRHVSAQGAVVVRIVGSGEALDVDALGVTEAPPWWRPAPRTSWQWQLTPGIDLSYDVTMYDIDLFETPSRVIDQLHADDRVVVCYFSAGAWENWRPDADGFPEIVLGRNNGWPGERWLDVRRLDLLGPIMEARLDLAVAKGCDGVEPDNVDGYQNATGFPLTAADQTAYNTFLAEEAHERGLSIGLKNDLAQVRQLVTLFDWALNEQCFEFDECEALRPFVDDGKAVFGVEYDLPPSAFCPEARTMGFSWLRKHISLGPWAYACWS
jgi:hypothetical protein